MSNRKLLRLEGNNALMDFLNKASIQVYELHEEDYGIPIKFIEGDSYRDKKVSIFVESDTYLNSDFVNLSAYKPRFIDFNTKTIYIGLKDFIGSLIRGEEFLFFELVNSPSMKSHEVFNYIYRYNEFLFSRELVEGLIHRIENRVTSGLNELNTNQVWNVVIDVLLLTLLLNDTRRHAFRLSIGDLSLGDLKLREYKDRDKNNKGKGTSKVDEDTIQGLSELLLGGMDEYKKKLEDRVINGGFYSSRDRIPYVTRCMKYINEVTQDDYFTSKFFDSKFPYMEGSTDLILDM